MGMIAVIVIGLIAGGLAKLLSPGPNPGGIIATILLGIAGAVLASFLGRAVGWYSSPGDGPGIIASVIGAMLVLGIYHLVTRRRA